MNSSLIERITRLLAFMLRHQPEQFDLEVDAFGFAEVDDVLDALSDRVDEDIMIEDLRQAIESGDRPRYEIQGDRIRALYGHSIAVEPGEPSKPPEMLYAALPKRDADRAKSFGMRGGRRRFLHLALSAEDAMETGRRAAREYNVITIRALDAWEEGINFYDRKSLFLAEEIPTHLLQVGPVHTDGAPDEERERPQGRDRGRPRRREGETDRAAPPERQARRPFEESESDESESDESEPEVRDEPGLDRADVTRESSPREGEGADRPRRRRRGRRGGRGERREAQPERSSPPGDRGERVLDRGDRPLQRGDSSLGRSDRPPQRGDRPERGRTFERGDRPSDRAPSWQRSSAFSERGEPGSQRRSEGVLGGGERGEERRRDARPVREGERFGARPEREERGAGERREEARAPRGRDFATERGEEERSERDRKASFEGRGSQPERRPDRHSESGDVPAVPSFRTPPTPARMQREEAKKPAVDAGFGMGIFEDVAPKPSERPEVREERRPTPQPKREKPAPPDDDSPSSFGAGV